MNLNYLLKKVARKAVPNPMRTESAQFFKKFPNNSKITVPVRIVSPVELTIESTDFCIILEMKRNKIILKIELSFLRSNKRKKILVFCF